MAMSINTSIAAAILRTSQVRCGEEGQHQHKALAYDIFLYRWGFLCLEETLSWSSGLTNATSAEAANGGGMRAAGFSGNHRPRAGINRGGEAGD